MVSHELRTPLTAVVGFVDELGRILEPRSPEVDEMLAIMEAGSVSLSNIVEDLLVAARSDMNELHVDRDPVEIAGVIDRVMSSSSRLLFEKRVGGQGRLRTRFRPR